MKPCVTCGNEIPESASTCRFCEARQPAGRLRRAPAGVIPTIDVKQGLPTVEEALRQLEIRLQTLRGSGERIARIIHGWGSTGRGGAIRAATRRHLRLLQRRGLVHHFLPGEEYSEFTTGGRALLDAHPRLRDQLRTDRENPGITLVELGRRGRT
jgi:hypothetical protein